MNLVKKHKIIILLTFLISCSLYTNNVNAKTTDDNNNTQQTEKITVENNKVDKVDINTADEAELISKLKGIGKNKAQAIIEYRTKHGKFTNLEQLTEVKGLGPAFVEKNKDIIVIN